MNLQVGVKLILQNAQGQVLLLKRSSKYEKLASTWDIPGGRINPREHLMTALQREVYEETRIRLNTNATLLAAQDIFPDDKKDLHVVRLTYRYVVDDESLVTLSDEHDEYEWATIETALQMSLDPLLKDVMQTVL